MSLHLPWALAGVALALAFVFKPWQTLRHRRLQNAWLGAMLILPWVWWSEHWLPAAIAVHLSGACLMVLMFGWPLAVASVLPIATAAALIGIASTPRPEALGLKALAAQLLGQADTIVADAVWTGMLPASLALLLGLATRRWLPRHLFVYILGRGFASTALAMMGAALLALAVAPPRSASWPDRLVAHWLLAWGEAFATGMFTAIFVAFRPQWLLTYTDDRYLPPSPPGDNPRP